MHSHSLNRTQKHCSLIKSRITNTIILTITHLSKCLLHLPPHLPTHLILGTISHANHAMYAVTLFTPLPLVPLTQTNISLVTLVVVSVIVQRTVVLTNKNHLIVLVHLTIVVLNLHLPPLIKQLPLSPLPLQTHLLLDQPLLTVHYHSFSLTKRCLSLHLFLFILL